MAEAFGLGSEDNLSACRGRHPHLGTFEPCGLPVKTLVLGATNTWFPMRLRALTLPRDESPVAHLVADLWKQLERSGGLAMHIGGEFPGLELELWGIRG